MRATFYTVAMLIALSGIAYANDNNRYTQISSSRSIEDCCRLMGQAAACGLNTNTISVTCGRLIDSMTSYGTPARGNKLKSCMAIASAAATTPPTDCSAVLQAIKNF